MHVRQRLSYGPHAPGDAREAIDALAEGRIADGALPELRLVVSELVTNAVRHGRGRRGTVDLIVDVQGGRVRVEVVDEGHGFDPPSRAPDPGEPGGWGLVVVDRLASRWGVEGDPATRVWAELALDGAGTGAGRADEPVYARNV